MGYLINNNPLGNYQKFIVPQADIITGSYFLTQDLSNNKFWFLTFASFRLINSTAPYVGFSHINLRQSGGINQGVIETSIFSTPGAIETDKYYTFAYNQQHSPNKLGSYSEGPRYLIEFDGSYISGNGDIELNFYYNEISI
jgi:hypothetical protein